jgi:phenylalanyl-tRNA synthetase alpha chain
MKEKLDLLEKEAEKSIDDAKTSQEIEDIRIAFLGKKGKLTDILKNIVGLSAEEKPEMGKISNIVKENIQKNIEEKKKNLLSNEESQKIAKEKIDITLPGKKIDYGHQNLVLTTMKEIIYNFKTLGYSIAEGPEIEDDYHNFEALNMPADHSAREMWDTFYLNNGYLMRTHTSPVQIHLMKEQKPPIKAIMPGKVYRRDNDVTHSPVFHQVEGLLVDRGITFADLKGTLGQVIFPLPNQVRRSMLNVSYVTAKGVLYAKIPAG